MIDDTTRPVVAETISLPKQKGLPVRPPPAFVAGFAKGEDARLAIDSGGRSREHMASLQTTLGVAPRNEIGRPQRHASAHKLGGLRPTLYNWWVFGKHPTARIAPEIASLPTIDIVTGEDSSNTGEEERSRTHKTPNVRECSLRSFRGQTFNRG